MQVLATKGLNTMDMQVIYRHHFREQESIVGSCDRVSDSFDQVVIYESYALRKTTMIPYSNNYNAYDVAL